MAPTLILYSEKFPEKGGKSIFIEHSRQSKVLSVFIQKAKIYKMLIFQQVMFDELEAWNWENSSKQGPKVSDITK